MKFVWSALLAGVGATLGFVLMCVAPFAAVATLAVRTLPLQYAFGAIAAMWAIEEFVGFAFLKYPHTLPTLGWGLATALAAIVATAAARRLPSPVFGFATAFVAYEMTLFAYGAAVGERGGFTPAIVAEVLVANLLGLALLGAVRVVLTSDARAIQSARH